MNPWARVALAGAAIVLSVFVAYLPALHGGFIWDDDTYVTNNPLLTAPDGLWRIWFSMDSPSQYFPLAYTVFRMEHSLWGFNPAGYHCVNILNILPNIGVFCQDSEFFIFSGNIKCHLTEFVGKNI